MREKRFSAVSIIVTAAITLLVTLGGLFLAAWLIIGPEGIALLEGYSLINTRFVGPYEKSEVVDGALNGMVSALGDRWSHYLDADSYAAQQTRRENVYVGIGVTVTYADERGLLIDKVNEGGGAQAAGLAAGEIITAVDGQSLAGEARYSATGLIQGQEGTSVTLEILGADGQTREVTVTRRKIETDPVSYELLENGVGYVRLENFYLRSADQLNAAVDDLAGQGAVALVFDLRNNGGGYLNQLTDMLDHLLPEGPIFRSQDRGGHETVTNSDSACVDLPMAVLVNKDTYSAAEFFAAELREWGVGVIVGEATSGKGYSQQTYPVPGGGAMSISTAKYFTGSGISLIGTGLTLDKEISLTDQEAASFSAGTLDHADDPQLQAALELLQEKLEK